MNRSALRDALGLDDDWARPLPAQWRRRDAVIAVGAFGCAVLGVEVMRALGGHVTWPRPVVYGVLALGVVPLVWRRRYPVAVMLVMGAHMFVTGMTQQLLMASLTMQVVYFFSIFSALAWGPDRRMTAVAAGGLCVFMFGWVAVQLAVASMRDELTQMYVSDGARIENALFGPAIAATLYSVMLNVFFFATAVGTGANSWRGARARARAEEQARTIEAQAAQLTERAVVDERLRIARELHDVVAHHVAAIGIQAAASRKLLTKDPAQAAASLSTVETSSRDAVTQMRGLLGTLRASDVPAGADVPDAAEAARPPEPGLAQLPRLVDEVAQAGLTVEVRDLLGSTRVPASVEHSLYRTVQEALTNVRRHSTATSASVTLRAGGGDGTPPYVEAEILDEGRPRAGTSGSGMGLLGMRERVTAHRGSAEIGPRLTGGYRVRVRLPLDEARA